MPMSLMRQRSKSEVMTAMKYEMMVGNDKDRFTMTELAALRNDLLQGGMVDSYLRGRRTPTSVPDGTWIRGFSIGGA